MLAQVERADRKDEPIVFLGWEPHPMNANFELTYLEGGDDLFGPDLGGATVYTNTRAGFVEECPNVGNFLNNLEFTLAMENEIMGAILDDGKSPTRPQRAWMPSNSDVLMRWLDGVTTRDGGDAGGGQAALGSETSRRAQHDAAPHRRATACGSSFHAAHLQSVKALHGLADRQQDPRRPMWPRDCLELAANPTGRGSLTGSAGPMERLIDANPVGAANAASAGS